MKPKIKGDTFYIPTPDGVYLRNQHGPCKVKGKAVYRWLERLIPYFDGRYTLEEITQGLPSDKQTMIRELVEVLYKNHFLKDLTHDQPHTLTPVEEGLYAPEIAFIDSFTDSAAYRFERFRQSRMLLIGSGLALTALVHANLKPGVQHLAVMITQECATNSQRHYDDLAAFNERGAQQTLRAIEAPAWDDESAVKAAIQPFDVVIAASDRTMLARAKMLNKVCREQNKALIQAIVVNDWAWIGPLVQPGMAGCWECAWRRFQTHLSGVQTDLSCYAFQDFPYDHASRFIATPTAAIVANELSFEMFKYLTNVGSRETTAYMTAIDLETLRIAHHPFLPHPCCESCEPEQKTPSEFDFQKTLAALERGPSLDWESFAKKATTCFESHLGIFTSLTEQDLVQLPLNISQVTIANPMLLPLPGPLVVTGVGADLSTPRKRATRRACEIYAASIVDRRSLLYGDNPRQVQANWFTLNEKPDLSEQWTWARDLKTGNAVLVPANMVYPSLRGIVPSEESAPGLASGFSWSEALSRAMIGLCKHITLLETAHRQEPVRRIRLDALTVNAENAVPRYKRMLDILGVGDTLTIYDITGSLQLPTFAFCIGEKTLTYTSDLDAREAISMGLEQVIQQIQSTLNNQPEYALPRVPNLSTYIRGNDLSQLTFSATQPDWTANQLYLQNTLSQHGWHMFAVPLQTDQALVHVLPYIVHVLLARVSSEEIGL